MQLYNFFKTKIIFVQIFYFRGFHTNTNKHKQTPMDAQLERSRGFLERVESTRKDMRALLMPPETFQMLDQMEERANQFVAVYNQLG
jgi:hypothetical protein